MDIKVKSLFLKSSPRKVRPVLYGLRGMTVEAALTELKFTNKKGAKMMLSLVKSGQAAAKENDLELDKVYIKSVNCTEGPRLKRRLIGSRGRAKPILKRMCHLNLIVSDDQINNQETSNLPADASRQAMQAGKEQTIAKKKETKIKQQ